LLYELYLLNKNGEYKDLYFEVTDDGNTSSLKIISEPNLAVKDFEIKGDSIITKLEIAEKILPLINKPYSPVKTLTAALEILRLYKRIGYSFAQINELKFDSLSQSTYC